MAVIHPALSFLKEDRPALCAMIHVGALPGSPRFGGDLGAVLRRAVEEANVLALCGCDALMIENMHDAPYVKGEAGPEVIAAMTAVGLAVRAAQPNLPFGVQVLAGANEAALAVAMACGAQFIRAEGFVFGHLGDEGYHDASAGTLLRARRRMEARGVAILADIKKKHSSHAMTADVDLAETARAAEFFQADGLIVTGAATGRETSPQDLAAVRRAVRLPVAVGSGVTAQNVEQFRDADLLIVGSSLKKDGFWGNALEPKRARALVKAVRKVGRE